MCEFREDAPAEVFSGGVGGGCGCIDVDLRRQRHCAVSTIVALFARPFENLFRSISAAFFHKLESDFGSSFLGFVLVGCGDVVVVVV